MSNDRKNLFKINLEEILGYSNQESKEVSEENFSEKDIHSDTDLLLKWLEEEKSKNTLDRTTALLLVEKHLSKNNISDEQRAKLEEFKSGFLHIDEEIAESASTDKNRKRLTVFILSLFFLTGAVLIYIISQKGERVAPVLHRLQFQANLESKQIEDGFNFIKIDPLHGLLEEATSSQGIQKNVVQPEKSVTPQQKLSLSDSYPFDCEVIVQTPVLNAPRIDGSEVGFLSSGAIVRVIGESGSFYRISSKDGRDGYILKQDVVKLQRPYTTPHSDQPISPFSPEAVDPRRP